VIDKGLTVGALGVTGKISNYPGVPGPVSGAELLAIIRQQAESFGAKFVTDRVVGTDLGSDVKTVFTPKGCLRVNERRLRVYLPLVTCCVRTSSKL
jgi:thioredoxin reductase (NADPH)